VERAGRPADVRGTRQPEVGGIDDWKKAEECLTVVERATTVGG